jgi:hypothetical protein
MCCCNYWAASLGRKIKWTLYLFVVAVFISIHSWSIRFSVVAAKTILLLYLLSSAPQNFVLVRFHICVSFIGILFSVPSYQCVFLTILPLYISLATLFPGIFSIWVHALVPSVFCVLVFLQVFFHLPFAMLFRWVPFRPLWAYCLGSVCFGVFVDFVCVLLVLLSWCFYVIWLHRLCKVAAYVSVSVQLSYFSITCMCYVQSELWCWTFLVVALLLSSVLNLLVVFDFYWLCSSVVSLCCIVSSPNIALISRSIWVLQIYAILASYKQRFVSLRHIYIVHWSAICLLSNKYLCLSNTITVPNLAIMHVIYLVCHFVFRLFMSVYLTVVWSWDGVMEWEISHCTRSCETVFTAWLPIQWFRSKNKLYFCFFFVLCTAFLGWVYFLAQFWNLPKFIRRVTSWQI